MANKQNTAPVSSAQPEQASTEVLDQAWLHSFESITGDVAELLGLTREQLAEIASFIRIERRIIALLFHQLAHANVNRQDAPHRRNSEGWHEHTITVQEGLVAAEFIITTKRVELMVCSVLTPQQRRQVEWIREAFETRLDLSWIE